jgi:hypothetical protein
VVGENIVMVKKCESARLFDRHYKLGLTKNVNTSQVATNAGRSTLSERTTNRLLFSDQGQSESLLREQVVSAVLDTGPRKGEGNMG